MFRAEQWIELLRPCGVKLSVATEWATVFERTVKESTFSSGPMELLDFLPQIAHESGGLTSMRENMHYSARRIRELGAIYGPKSRWATAAARASDLAGNPQALANVVYGGRFGNTGPDDGWKYIGRSPIGITFKDNYQFMSDLLGQDYVGIPHLLEQPHFALEACIGWWEGKIPDKILGNTRLIRKTVQGGSLGLEEVEAARKKLALVLETMLGA